MIVDMYLQNIYVASLGAIGKLLVYRIYKL